MIHHRLKYLTTKDYMAQGFVAAVAITKESGVLTYDVSKVVLK